MMIWQGWQLLVGDALRGLLLFLAPGKISVLYVKHDNDQGQLLDAYKVTISMANCTIISFRQTCQALCFL